MVLIFVILGLTWCVDYYQVKGTPYENGVQLGNLMNETILEMYELKMKAYSSNINEWEKIAKDSLPSVEKYAPVTYSEMKGLSDAHGLNMSIISMLNTEYEMEMKYGIGAKKCSGFSASSSKWGVITGQTNDENPDEFLGMNGMTVQKRFDESSSLESLIFTHHGYMMYMGMNSEGLVVEWQYIDNGNWVVCFSCLFLPNSDTCAKGERAVEGEFLPSTVTLREMLTKKSIFEAMEFLRNTPQPVCNNFMITRFDEGVIDVEISPTNFTAVYQPPVALNENLSFSQEVCHTNTIVYSDAMMDNDIGTDPTSRPRYEKCRELTKSYREEFGGMNLERGKEWLLTPPILRDGKWEGVLSIAAMIFQSKERILNIKFYEEKDFRVYSL